MPTFLLQALFSNLIVMLDLVNFPMQCTEMVFLFQAIGNKCIAMTDVVICGNLDCSKRTPNWVDYLQTFPDQFRSNHPYGTLGWGSISISS